MKMQPIISSSVLAFFLSKARYLIRTASFLQKFTVSENSLRMLFANDVRRQLDNIFNTIL